MAKKSRSGSRHRTLAGWKKNKDRPAVSPKVAAMKQDIDYGKGIEFKRSKSIILTSAAAEKHLSHQEVPEVERHLRESHVYRLMEQMVNRNFRAEEVALGTARVQGDTVVYRVNGQHTCWARLELGSAARFDIPVRLNHYEVADMDALRRLYASLDRGGARTEGNIIRANLGGREEWAGFSARMISSLKSGLKVLLWDKTGEAAKHSADELSQLMIGEHKGLCLLVGNFLKASARKEARHMWKAGVIAAMMATYSKRPRIATDFWPAVRDGFAEDAKGKTDARLRLHRELLQAAVGTKGPVGDRKVVTNEELYRGCIRAWRNWRTGKTMKTFQWVSKADSRPFVN
jgi:hypothetical protein